MTAFLWDLLSAAAIVGASWFVGGWIAGIVGSLLAQTRVDPMVRALLVRLTKPLVIGAAIVAALSQVGVDIRVLLAILAAGAIAGARGHCGYRGRNRLAERAHRRDRRVPCDLAQSDGDGPSHANPTH